MIPRLRFLWVVAAVTSSALAQAQTYGEVFGNEGLQKIVRNEAGRFVEQFNAMSATEAISVEESFYPAVTERVSSTHIPNRDSAYRSLQVRFGSFMSDLAAFLLVTQGNIVFGDEQVSTYLKASRQVGRCGRIPCPMGCPQGCEDTCDPCTTR